MQPIPEERADSRIANLLKLSAEQAISYVESVRERSVSPSRAGLAALAGFHETFPDEPCDPVDIVQKLHSAGSPATTAIAGGRYFGFVNGGIVPAALAASWLVDAWNQNASLRVMSPIAAELEDIVLQWVCDALGLPSGCGGGLVTGATMANFTALVAARHALLNRAGWDVA